MPLLDHYRPGQLIAADDPWEKNARVNAKIFKSTVESFKVSTNDLAGKSLFPDYTVVVLYPERIVINVESEQRFASLESCRAARANAARLVGASLGFAVTGGPLQTAGDTELSLNCLLATPSYPLRLLVRSISATDTWLRRTGASRKQ